MWAISEVWGGSRLPKGAWNPAVHDDDTIYTDEDCDERCTRDVRKKTAPVATDMQLRRVAKRDVNRRRSCSAPIFRLIRFAD